MVSILAMALILIAMPFKNDAIISLCTYLIAFISVVLLVKCFVDNATALPMAALLFMILAFIALFVMLLFSSVDFRQGIVKVLCFLEIPILMLSFEKKSEVKLLPILFWTQYALSWYYMYLSTTEKAHFFVGTYSNTFIPELTLGYNNPNETAIYLLCCFMVLGPAVLYFKSIALRVLFIINTILVFRLIVLTQSRAGILVAIASTFFLVFRNKISVKKWLIRVVLLFPLVIVFAIIFFHDELVSLRLLGDSVETGRIGVYNQVFDMLEFHEIFVGDFTTHLFDNLHNVYISIFGTIGIFGVIVYVAYLSSMTNRIVKAGLSLDFKKAGFFNVLLLIAHSSVEASLFVAGSAYAMSFICVYCIAVAQEQCLEAK